MLETTAVVCGKIIVIATVIVTWCASAVCAALLTSLVSVYLLLLYQQKVNVFV